MERKITMKKGSIEKNIPVNLVSEYLHLGWKEVKNESKFDKETEEKPSTFRLK